MYDGRGKRDSITVTGSVQGLDEIVTHQYDGLGALSRMTSTKGSGIDDQYWTDALGNILFTDGLYGDTRSKYAYDRPLGPLATLFEVRLPGNPPSDTIADDTYIAYDSTGAEESTVKFVWFWNDNWNAAFWPAKGSTWTWNAYSADGRLRVAQRSWNDPVTAQRKHSFVEHRYDALGRRVMTRTQADSSCNLPEPECMSTMDRFVWDGDQLAHELRAKLPYFTHGWALEVEVTGGDFYGRIRYAHAGDMDRPVLFWKDNGTPIVPHWNFRGMAVAGSDPTSGNPLQNMSWPGRDRGAYFGADTRITPTIPTHWQESLTDAQGDATGQLYRRNRFFNPNTAQFTQEDPLGVSGGFNLYGFANGDPVNFSDPFGLCPPIQSCLAFAGGASLADGPLPFGEMLGALAIATGVTAIALNEITRERADWKPRRGAGGAVRRLDRAAGIDATSVQMGRRSRNVGIILVGGLTGILTPGLDPSDVTQTGAGAPGNAGETPPAVERKPPGKQKPKDDDKP